MERATTGGKTCRISVNPERRSSVWWDYARARFDAPTALGPMLVFFGAQEVCVDPGDAIAIRTWAAKVPDWDDAEPPLLITVDEA